MVALRTVDALLVEPRHAGAVVGHAYDALSPQQRRQLAASNPDSFLNVLRSPGDEPGADAAELLERSGAALARLIAAGRFRPHPPGLYLYRLRSGQHVQTAVVADLAVAETGSGRVRAHERTRVAKEEELARHLAHVRIQSSPVGLGYRGRPSIDALAERAAAGAPQLDFETVDGVQHQVWRVADPGTQTALQDAFAAVEATYIIDGHHRVAAAARVDGAGHFLAALIPDHALRLLPYHRVVAGPLPADLPVRFAHLAERYDVAVTEAAEAPRAPDRFLLFVGDGWFELGRRAPLDGRLAVEVADSEVLRTLFDVRDARHDPRLSFLPGGHDIGRRAAQAAAQVGGAALLVSPPSVLDVFNEADRGRPLPPKSTWFEPKLRSGIFLVRR